MSQHRYHYLISGLPDLTFDEQKEIFTISDFKQILKDSLHEEDYEQVKLVFLKDDNENLVNFLETGEVKTDLHGSFTEADFKEMREDTSFLNPGEDKFPSYMTEVMKKAEGDEKFNRIDYRHLLADRYYDHIMHNGETFLKEFTRLEYNIENLRAFIESGRYKMDQERFITGSSSLAAHLRQSVSRSLTKDPEFDLFDEVLSISEIRSIAEKEMKFDQLKWQLIDEMTFFEYFNINWILGYLHKLFILRRWARLDSQSGEDKLRNIITGLEEYAAEHVES
jgi:hypothetical protein